MSWVLTVALIAGAFTYAFRLFPTLSRLHDLPEGGRLSRFLSSTGPAAIATLFVASILPDLGRALGGALPLPLIAGVSAVIAIWLWLRSVVTATLGGGIAYAAVFAVQLT